NSDEGERHWGVGDHRLGIGDPLVDVLLRPYPARVAELLHTGGVHGVIGDARRLPPDDAVQLRPDQRLGTWSDLMADRAFGEVSFALLGVTGGKGRAAESEKRHGAEYDTQHFHHSHTSQKLSPAGSWRPLGHRPARVLIALDGRQNCNRSGKDAESSEFLQITHRPFAEFPWGSGHIAPERSPCETSP